LFAEPRDPRIISFASFAEEEKLRNILVGGSNVDTVYRMPKGRVDARIRLLRLGRCGDPEAGICTCTEKKRKRMDSKGGGGAVCQCVYRRSGGKTGKSGGYDKYCKNSSSSGDRGDEIGTVV
jgi:hypothetical protein